MVARFWLLVVPRRSASPIWADRFCRSTDVQRRRSRSASTLERLAKERLEVLKGDDEEAYMKLIDTSITHLLKQTDTYLDSLAQAVVDQHRSEGNQQVDYDMEEGRCISPRAFFSPPSRMGLENATASAYRLHLTDPIFLSRSTGCACVMGVESGRGRRNRPIGYSITYIPRSRPSPASCQVRAVRPLQQLPQARVVDVLSRSESLANSIRVSGAGGPQQLAARNRLRNPASGKGSSSRKRLALVSGFLERRRI
ncbi:hypothetical protein LXA43DRAFT_587609 [Ganoderma leucocontextum]|nr:hypothetical protein LXA43DRAFT_587609 [Ganoderma leucocontextum]